MNVMAFNSRSASRWMLSNELQVLYVCTTELLLTTSEDEKEGIHDSTPKCTAFKLCLNVRQLSTHLLLKQVFCFRLHACDCDVQTGTYHQFNFAENEIW